MLRRLLVSLLLALALTGSVVAGVPGPHSSEISSSFARAVRSTVNTGEYVAINFPVPGARGLGDLAVGPDGNLWFTDEDVNKVGQITVSGAVRTFPIPSNFGRPKGITAGPDGNVWFTEYFGNKIGRITPAGMITEFPIPTTDALATGIAAGPDGNLWFTESNANMIGRISPTGTITEFPLTSFDPDPRRITAGPDGNMWFTEPGSNQIGRISPTGTITQFPLPTPDSFPFDITLGPDGALWFTELYGNKIGRITQGGAITEFPLPQAPSYPAGIAVGPDGALWFIEGGASRLGRITTSGAITVFSLPNVDFPPFGVGISAGPDDALWLGEYTEIAKIGADTASSKSVSVTEPTVGQNVTYRVTVVNGGPLAATNLAITDQLPAGLSFVAATASKGTYSSSTGVWQVGRLEHANSVTLDIEVRVEQAGNITNTATKAAVDQFDPVDTNNSGTVLIRAFRKVYLPLIQK